MWVARLGGGLHHLLVCLPGRQSVSESEPPGGDLSVPVTSLLTVTLLGPGCMERGASSGNAGRANEKKGVSTKPAAPVSPLPHTTGDQVRAMSLRSPSSGPAPSVVSPLDSPFHAAPHAAGLAEGAELGCRRSLRLGPQSQRQQALQEGPPGPAAVASPVGRPWSLPRLRRPRRADPLTVARLQAACLGLVPHVGRARPRHQPLNGSGLRHSLCPQPH